MGECESWGFCLTGEGAEVGGPRNEAVLGLGLLLGSETSHVVFESFDRVLSQWELEQRVLGEIEGQRLVRRPPASVGV